jgi:EamA domain-containing membrane protein RarD
MKRKVYATRRERMIDQILGFLVFPLVNVSLGITLWIISQMISSLWWFELSSVLPWLVNGIIIVLALLWRPEFAMGYIAFFGVAVTVVTLLGVLFLAACFVTIFSATVVGDQQAKALFVILILGGLVGLGALAIYGFLYWVRSSKNNSH